MVDETKLHQFIGQMLGDLGGALSVPLVRIGDRLGLYKALHDNGPMTPAELATKTDIAERYAREWLSHQAASGYITTITIREVHLPPEQAMVFAEPKVPSICKVGSISRQVMMENQDVGRAGVPHREGSGLGRAVTVPVLRCRSFFPPGLSQQSCYVLAAGAGRRRRQTGARRDGGRRRLWTRILDGDHGEGFPEFDVHGLDFHPGSVEQARLHAEQHGVSKHSFRGGFGRRVSGKDLDLVTFFDCLHDMGDPVGAARHVRQTLKPDGRWMIVEPAAGDRLEDNLNPVGRLYYAASTMICVPTSLDQPVGAALGAQAGFEKLSSVIKRGGFGRVRKATETPFNMILEARP